MPLISHALPLPSAFLLALMAGLLILVANMVYSLARERRRLERRTSLLKQWVRIEHAQPTVRYRKIEIRVQSHSRTSTMLAAPHGRTATRTRQARVRMEENLSFCRFNCG